MIDIILIAVLIVCLLAIVFFIRVIYVLDIHISAIRDLRLLDPEFSKKLDLIDKTDEKIHALMLNKWTKKQFFPELYEG